MGTTRVGLRPSVRSGTPTGTSCTDGFSLFAKEHDRGHDPISPSFTLKFAGNDGEVFGRIHSNEDLEVSGNSNELNELASAHGKFLVSGGSSSSENTFKETLSDRFEVGADNIFNQTVEWVTEFLDNNAPNTTFNGSPGDQLVASSPPLTDPISFSVGDYAPGGAKAILAGLTGDYNSFGSSQAFGASEANAGGLYYVDGDVTFSPSGITVAPTKGITIVATGKISMSGSDHTFFPFIDNLLLFSTSTDPAAITPSGGASTKPEEPLRRTHLRPQRRYQHLRLGRHISVDHPWPDHRSQRQLPRVREPRCRVQPGLHRHQDR